VVIPKELALYQQSGRQPETLGVKPSIQSQIGKQLWNVTLATPEQLRASNQLQGLERLDMFCVKFRE
jgi:hypothetical protein